MFLPKSVNALPLAATPGKDQRVYFFNTEEIIGNKYGTASPIPFRVLVQRIGLDMDAIRCFGEYSYKITNPILFYTNVCGNVENEYLRSEIDSQLKPEPKVDAGWTCSCGTVNKGKFCSGCGAKRPW